MARDLNSIFNLTQSPSLSRNVASSAVSKVLAFDDIGDFSEERQRITRKLEEIQDTAPKVDFSDFSNHVFFDSAVSKFNIAKDKILNSYPYNGSSEDIDLFRISGSLYENYVTANWPRSQGHAYYASSSPITASDSAGKLFVGTSSLYVSARIAPALPSVTYNVLSVLSGSSVGHYYGYTFFATNTSMTFRVMSGAFQYDYTANFVTASIQNKPATIAAMYDANAQQLSLYLDKSKKSTVAINLTPKLSFGPATVTVGSSFSGALGEVRVMHTASELYHFKNYNRSVTSEDFVRLNYRFSEDNVGNSAIDSTVIDYSNSGLHGQVVNYQPGFRQTGSLLASDSGTPIIYPMHPAVMSFTGSIQDEAELFDATNRSHIMRLIPGDILQDDDDAQDVLISFSLAMARYFDELKMYFDQFSNLKTVNNTGVDETPDVMLPVLKKYLGWKVTDHFNDSEPLQFLFGETVLPSGSLDVPLYNIKNQFWRRILSNLPYLYKTKGKRDNINSFFNVLGINSNIVSLKEFGSVTNSTIQDEYLEKTKPVSFLGLANGQSVIVPPLSASNNGYTVEVTQQLPYAISASIINDVFTIRQSGSTSYVNISYENDNSGSLGTVGLYAGPGDAGLISSAQLPIFNGNLTHFALTIDSSSHPSLAVRQVIDGKMVVKTVISNPTVSYPASSGSLNVQFGSSIGFNGTAAGLFGQARVWNRALSDRDLDAHAYNLENVADSYLYASGSALQVQYSFNSGAFIDLSQNNFSGTGVNLSGSQFQSLLVDYSYLSPTFDLKWTQNKIRIRNKTKLSLSDIANDTNQVALEFNLIDALNEDIAKIFSSFDEMNNIIGASINKYRASYDDLEGYRRIYFSKLTDSLHFTRFFKLFKWFDRKLAQSIQQLLPARTNFIGGEFVVDSHMLERNKYQYLYPVFHTPKDINEGRIETSKFSGSIQQVLLDGGVLQSPYVQKIKERERKFANPASGVSTVGRPSSNVFEASLSQQFVNVNRPDFSLTWQNPYIQYPTTAQNVFIYGDPGVSVSVDPQGNISANNTNSNSSSSKLYILYKGLGSGTLVPLGFTLNTGPQGFSPEIRITNNPNAVTPIQIGPNSVGSYSITGSSDASGSCSASFLFPGQDQLYVKKVNPARFSTVITPSVSYGVSSNNNSAANSVNYKDEYVRRIVDRRWASERGRYIDPKITNGLWDANGFVFGNVDSDDSELAYAGTRKFIRLRAMYGNVSGTFQLPPAAYANTYYGHMNTFVTDPNGFLFTPNFFGQEQAYNQYGGNFTNWYTTEPKLGAVLRFKVSGANNPVNFANIAPLYTDGLLTNWSYYGSTALFKQNPYKPVSGSPGWFQFEYAMNAPFTTAFALADVIKPDSSSASFGFYVATSGAVYFLRDAYLEFQQPLSKAGVNYYHRLQNTRDNKYTRYINAEIMGTASTELYSGSYYAWANNYFPNQNLTQEYAQFGISEKMYYVNSAGNFSYSPDFGSTSVALANIAQYSGQQWIIDPLNENNVYLAYTNFASSVFHVLKSVDGGNSFSEVYVYTDPNNSKSLVTDVGCSEDYWFYYLSNGPGIFGRGSGSTFSSTAISALATGVGIYTDHSINVSRPSHVYVATTANGLYRSIDYGATFTQVMTNNSISFGYTGRTVVLAPNGYVYAVGNIPNTTTTKVWASPNGNPATFGTVYVSPDTIDYAYLSVDANSNVYLGYSSGSTFGPAGSGSRPPSFTVYGSYDNGGTWNLIDGQADPTVYSIVATFTGIPGKKKIVEVGHTYSKITGGTNSFTRRAYRQSNQQNIGPRSLATSFYYVQSQLSGTLTSNYRLGNVSEFPHYGGLFQMRNLVLGTTDTGKIGNTDDAIVQVRHIGSVVNVMWPDQSQLTAPVPGFGELAIGQSPGNLTTGFTYGTSYDTTSYDHVALYCYALKQSVGTSEDIEIIIQRRPLSSIGFATDQSVEYESVTATSVARYKDIIHTKTIDYSDLTDTNVSYVIDLPLINVRELRIGVRQKYGQSAGNQNFLVWGRFINSSKET